jgi:hypothetical protein
MEILFLGSRRHDPVLQAEAHEDVVIEARIQQGLLVFGAPMPCRSARWFLTRRKWSCRDLLTRYPAPVKLGAKVTKAVLIEAIRVSRDQILDLIVPPEGASTRLDRLRKEPARYLGVQGARRAWESPADISQSEQLEIHGRLVQSSGMQRGP